MASNRQRETSRANGAKSRGPITAQGKARVSENAVRHGLAARAVVLQNESAEEYDKLLQSYVGHWQPQHQTEEDVVLQLVNAQWRLRRIGAIETAILDTEIGLRAEDFDKEIVNGSSDMRQADAWMSVAVNNTPSLDQLHRYESRYWTIYHRALKTLLWLVGQRVGHAARPAVGNPFPSDLTSADSADCTNKPSAGPPVQVESTAVGSRPETCGNGGCYPWATNDPSAASPFEGVSSVGDAMTMAPYESGRT